MNNTSVVQINISYNGEIVSTDIKVHSSVQETLGEEYIQEWNEYVALLSHKLLEDMASKLVEYEEEEQEEEEQEEEEEELIQVLEDLLRGIKAETSRRKRRNVN